jgi:acyl-CoA synthetase (AMP-forming)/AMP-acid ligase II
VAAVAWPAEHGSARGIVAFHCCEGRSAQQIRDAMQQRVPRYAVPTQVVKLASIPLTENGKVDRKALIEALEREPAACSS